MTSRTLLALISAAWVWNLPNITLAQAMQGDSTKEGEPAPPVEGDATGSPLLQMPAKKTPLKVQPAPQKPGAPAAPVKGRTTPQKTPLFKPTPGAKAPPARNSRLQPPAPPLASPGMNQLGLLLVANHLGPGAGLEYLRRSFSWMDWGLQVTGTQTRLTHAQVQDVDEFLETRLVTARLGGRLFYGRWLYAGLGLSFNSLQGSYGWEGAAVVNEQIAVDITARFAMVDLVLGGQWEFSSGFYVGIDWAGFGVPIASTVEYDENSELDDLVSILTGSSTPDRIHRELDIQFKPYYGILKIGYIF